MLDPVHSTRMSDVFVFGLGPSFRDLQWHVSTQRGRAHASTHTRSRVDHHVVRDLFPHLSFQPGAPPRIQPAWERKDERLEAPVVKRMGHRRSSASRPGGWTGIGPELEGGHRPNERDAVRFNPHPRKNRKPPTPRGPERRKKREDPCFRRKETEWRLPLQERIRTRTEQRRQKEPKQAMWRCEKPWYRTKMLLEQP